MNRGSFRVGNQDTPASVRREISALMRQDYRRGADRDGPTPEVELKPPHRCGSRYAILLRAGELHCRRCGRIIQMSKSPGYVKL